MTERINEWQPIPYAMAPVCPYCGAWMTRRENAEQGICDGCYMHPPFKLG